MYQVVIKNGSKKTVINSISTHIEAPRLLSGNIKKSINSIDNFTFTILPNNAGYDEINPLTTLVEVLNTKTNEVEFEGRVLNAKVSMDSKGLFSKNIVCESELAYLMDSVQEYGEYKNITVKNFLNTIINKHNEQVPNDKRFTLGEVTVEDSNTLYRYLGYSKTLDTIKNKLIDKLGGELQIRKVNNVRYLDYLTSIGEVKSTQIRIAKNLKSLDEEKDPSQIITRLIPLGATIEKEISEKEEGRTGEESEKLTISSVNNGKNYIDDLKAQETYGVIVGTVDFNDVTKADTLLKKGQKYLEQNNKVVGKYSLSVLDLSVIGLDLHSFKVGNQYKLINPIMNINEYLRVIDKDIDIYNPQNSKLTVGQKFYDIKSLQVNTGKRIISLNNSVTNNKTKLDVHEKNILEAKNNIKTINSFVNEVTSSYFIDEAIIYPNNKTRFHIEIDKANYIIKVKYDLTYKPYILSKTNGRILNATNLTEDKELTYKTTSTRIANIHSLYVNKSTYEFMLKHFSEVLTYEECKNYIYVCTFNETFFSGCSGASETVSITII